MTRFFIACSLVLCFASCEQSNELVLPGKVGPAGELLIVIENQLWDGPIGKAIEEISGKPYDLLPQYEAEFSLAVINKKDFDRLWKPHRNIILIDMGDRIDTQEPSLRVVRDKYANGQLFIEIKGKTPGDIAGIIKEKGADLVTIINGEELERVADLVRSYPNVPLEQDVQGKIGVALDFPKDAHLAKASEDFIWVNREMTRMKGGNNHDVKQGWLIYTYPYTTDSVFSLTWLLNKRDSILKANVPGDSEGSYMKTTRQIVPTYEELSFDGMFSSQIKGLWEMHDDYMGGPFFSMTVYDEARQRIVTVEGYAYAPYFGKREYIREVEAVIKTMRLTDF